MKKHFKNIGLPAASLLGMLIGGYTPQAYAGPTLSFAVDGGPAVSCADNAACDMNPAAGAVVYIGSLGGVFDVNVATGLTRPFLPGSQMDLNSVNIKFAADGPHSLSIMFSETDFTLLNAGGVAGFGGMIEGGSVTASAYFDDSTNALFNLASQIGTTGPLSGPFFSAAFTGPGPQAASYSMTQVLTVSTTGSTRFNFGGDFELTMVPEPASVALLGAALLLVTKSVRKRFRRG